IRRMPGTRSPAAESQPGMSARGDSLEGMATLPDDAHPARPGAPILDASQRAVIDLPDAASATIIGAPGTGKTTTLVEVAADRVLNRGWLPNELLVLTT